MKGNYLAKHETQIFCSDIDLKYIFGNIFYEDILPFDFRVSVDLFKQDHVF